MGRVMPNLRKRMNKWVVQRMGWSLDIRMLNQILRMIVMRMWMGNLSR